MNEAILYSMVGGLIVLALQWLWKIAIPHFVQRFYHHATSISGKWNTIFYEGNKEYHEVVTLKQKGRKISGQKSIKRGILRGSTYYYRKSLTS